MEFCRGTWEPQTEAHEGRQGPAQSNRRTPEKAEKLRGSTRREVGDSEDSHPEDSEEVRSDSRGLAAESRDPSAGSRVTEEVRSKKTQQSRERSPG